MIVKKPKGRQKDDVRLSSSCPSIPSATKIEDGFCLAVSKRRRVNMSIFGNFTPPGRKMSASSDSNTGDGEAVDSNIKIKINDITPSNSQEFLHTLTTQAGSIKAPKLSRNKTSRLINKRHSAAEVLCHRAVHKSCKKELTRRQSWSSIADRCDKKREKIQVQKCWSLSSLDSDLEDIFYDARDIPISSTAASATCDGSSRSIPDGMKEKQRSFSAGSKEDAFISICSQAPGAVQSMNDISVENVEIPNRKDEKKHSLVNIGSSKSPNKEEWLLAPRTPLQKSISTPSIIAAQEIQEMVQRRDRESRDSLFYSHRLSLRNVGESSIALLREEDEPEEMTNRVLPPISLSVLLRENILGIGIQDSDDEKPFSKRKKRGSLFFRKKRNKEKEKESKKLPHQFVSICYSTSATCDVCHKALANKSALRCESCMVTVHDSSCKDHAAECKPKPSKSPPTKDKNVPTLQVPVGGLYYPLRYRYLLGTVRHSMIDLGGGKASQQSKEKRLSAGSINRPQSLIMTVSSADPSKLNTPPSSKVICEEKEADPVDDSSNTNITETNSASMESLDEGVLEISDIEDDNLLRLIDEEPETWSATVDKKMLKKFKEKDLKRQEAIYELIITEKHHCLTLKIMQKIFAHGMMKELNISKDMVERIFPCLENLLDFHVTFLHKLRERQSVDSIVAAVADILLDQFQGRTADQMRESYGHFCSQHKEALSLYKDILKSDRKFQSFIKRCCSKPLCKARGIPECILLVTQRITKYPLLIDALIRTTRDNKVETENLCKALASIKNIITQVNGAVAEKERETRLLEIYNKVDAKSTAFFKNKKFKKSDLLSSNRKLRHEGSLAWKSARGKTVDAHGIILSDVIVLLQENNQKYYFSSLDNKSSVVSLQKLLVREKAGQNSKGIYLISSNPNDPEMYELICPSTKEKKIWVQRIRECVELCPDIADQDIQEEVEEDRKIEEARHTKLKELFGLMHEKDLGVAQVCEEKMKVLVDTLDLMGYETEGFEHLHYTQLLQKNDEETKQLLVATLNNASQLASSLYASGSNLNRSVSSAGEHHSDAYTSPVLPKRAETFGGFDNPNKDGSSKVLVLKKKLLQLKELGGEVSPSNERELSFSDSSLNITGHESQGTCTPKLTSRQGSPEKSKQFSPGGMLSPKSGDRESQKFASQPQLSASSKNHLEQVAELAHHLSVLTCLLNHHFSHVESLRMQLSEMSEKLNKSSKEPAGEKRDRRSIYRPDHQLEELRNIQEQLSQERARWQKERLQQEEELGKKRKELLNLKEQLQTEQNSLVIEKDILQRQLESLQREGIVISPLLGAESITDDDSSSCPDVSMHQRGASFDLQSMHHLQLSSSRQSWSGPGSEEQRQTLNSNFLLSLSTSNLPLSVSRDTGCGTLAVLCKTTSRHTQWSEEDCSTENRGPSKSVGHSPNGLIGCQPTSQTLPVVTCDTPTVFILESGTSLCSKESNSNEEISDCCSKVMIETLQSSPEQRHNEPMNSSVNALINSNQTASQSLTAISVGDISIHVEEPPDNKVIC